MSDTVITALIVAASSIICQLLINRSNRKKQTEDDIEKEQKRAVEQAVKDERLENRLSSIEGKLDIHNGYAEKLGEIQTDIAVIKNDIKTLYKQGNS
mgnify:FL=1